jgi:hypothetical protein
MLTRRRKGLSLVLGAAVVIATAIPACTRDRLPVPRPSLQVDAAPPPIEAAKVLLVENLLRGKTCQVHGLALEEVIVPIRYGMISFDDELLAAMGNSFPNATDPFRAGCVEDAYTHVRVKHCVRCVEAKRAWLVAHPDIDVGGGRRLPW